MIDKLQENSMFATFKTKEQVENQISAHCGEEQFLIWLGFFYANNFIAHIMNEQIDEHRAELEALLELAETTTTSPKVINAIQKILEN